MKSKLERACERCGLGKVVRARRRHKVVKLKKLKAKRRAKRLEGGE